MPPFTLLCRHDAAGAIFRYTMPPPRLLLLHIAISGMRRLALRRCRCCRDALFIITPAMAYACFI